MKLKYSLFCSSITIIFILFLISISGNGFALSPPHNQENGIECVDCHNHYFGFMPRGGAQERMCKTCHNPNGKAPNMAEVANHVVNQGVTIVDCGSCHNPHDPSVTVDPHEGGMTQENLSLIRGDISKYVSQAEEPAIFQSRPSHFAFAEENPPWIGICQSCHELTDYHTNNSSGSHSHFTGADCTMCHPHSAGFLPMGGSCLECHSDAQGSRRQIAGAGGDFSKNSHHVSDEVKAEDCLICHYTGNHGSHVVRLIHPDNGTTINYTPENPESLEEFCVSCHDGDGAARQGGGGITPFSDGRAVPDLKNQWANSAHNNIGYSGNNGNSYGNNSDFPDKRGEPITCFGDGKTTGCHGNAHGSDNIELLSAGKGVSLAAFCYGCHTDGKIMNIALSGSSLADDIEQAFKLGSIHDLGTKFGINGKTFEMQCTTCHNPHAVTGKHWDVDKGLTPVTRPDFTVDPQSNPRAMGTRIWGDSQGEKISDFAGSGTYRTPFGDIFAGNVLPDYVTFCLDCHSAPQSQFGVHGAMSWGWDEPHGTNSANVPDGSGSVPDWFACGLAKGRDGDDCLSTEEECWPVKSRAMGEQLFSREPYYQNERMAGANFVLSCTDCHEAHGSTVGSFLRTKVNNGQGTTNWNYMCNNCHYYYSDWHAGMGCANSSCHAPNKRLGESSSIHGMDKNRGSSATRVFNPDLVVDMRFENNLNDSGTWRMHGVWRVSNGKFVSGISGRAIEVNDTPVEVGTRNSWWSTDEGMHGTWKHTEMKYNMTLEAWVYPTSDEKTAKRVLAKHTYWDGGYSLLLRKVDGTLRAALITNMTGGGPNWGPDGWDPEDCNGLRGAFSTVSAPLNQWTHIAATYDYEGPDRDPLDPSVGRIRIYVNGEDKTWSFLTVPECFAQPGPGEDAMFPYSEHSPENQQICYENHWCASALSIGGVNWSSPNDAFIGRIDEVKVWNITKDPEYFEYIDEIMPPRIDVVLGQIGSDVLNVTFTEEAFATSLQSGSLKPSDFILRDDDGKRSIVKVDHAPGSDKAVLVLSSPLNANGDIGVDMLSAHAASIFDEYGNDAALSFVVISPLTREYESEASGY